MSSTHQWSGIEVPQIDLTSGIEIVGIPLRDAQTAFKAAEFQIASALGNEQGARMDFTDRIAYSAMVKTYERVERCTAPNNLALVIEPQATDAMTAQLITMMYKPGNDRASRVIFNYFKGEKKHPSKDRIVSVITRKIGERSVITNPYFVPINRTGSGGLLRPQSETERLIQRGRDRASF